MPAGTSWSSAPNGQLLIDCLTHKSHGRDLPRRLDRPLQRHARAQAGDLEKRALIEDVIQQTWLILVRRGPRKVNPAGNAVAFAKAVLRTSAVRDVRAAHAPPGQRTRRREEDGDRSRPPVISLDVEVETRFGERIPCADAVEATANGAEDPMDAVCEDLDMKELLHLASMTGPDFVTRALALICFDGLTTPEAAKELGVCRFRLRRALKRWAEDQNLRRRLGEGCLC